MITQSQTRILRPVLPKFQRPHDQESRSECVREAYNWNDVATCALAGGSDQRRWHYCLNLTTDEALLLEIFDPKESGVARRSPHTVFVCDEDEGPPDRRSIEVRCLVFWEDQSNG